MRTCKPILLADDDESAVTALTGCLSQLGYDVVSVQTSKEALNRLELDSPQLVLAEVSRPQIDGFELLHAIRRDPERAETPVILLTTLSDPELRLRALEAGASDFIPKPIDVRLFQARVRALLQHQSVVENLRASRDEAARRHAELQHLQREQRELIEFIVHDLKGPLTAISANTEWAYEQFGPDHPVCLGALHDVLESARRLREMIGELLLTSQLDDGRLRLNLQDVPLGGILQSVIRRFQVAARQRSLELLGPGNVTSLVRADSPLLKRVLENLVDNALRYTPAHGRIAVRASDDECITLEVANTGQPIPEAERDRIFQKFSRGHQDSTALGHAGLGLYFCRRVVEAHGGEIRVVETHEYPTCFRIHLPSTVSRERPAPLSATVPLARAPLIAREVRDESPAESYFNGQRKLTARRH